MTYEHAKAFSVWFGKHHGKTLSEIAEADYGYVVWLNTWEGCHGELKEAVDAFLGGYELTFHAAGNCKVMFTQYRGQTVDDIASTDRGLIFLDGLRDNESLDEGLKRCLDVYFQDPIIQRAIQEAVG